MNKQLLKTILNEQLTSLRNDSERMITRAQSLDDAANYKEITIITGVRRCGKSSLLKAFIRSLPQPENILYINFEDPRLIEFCGEDFELLYQIWTERNSAELGNTNPELQKLNRIAVFDEIQNVEGWERWMNFLSEQKKFKIFISGANSQLLSSELATHLTGRHKDIILHPLSFYEILNDKHPELAAKFRHHNDADLILTTEETALMQNVFQQYFTYGGFPRVWQTKDVSLAGEYYNDILLRDIIHRYKIRQPHSIARVGTSVMSDIGRKINKSKLASTLDIKDPTTVAKYLTYFEHCYLGKEIRKFDLSIRRQNRSLPKFYAIDHVFAKRVSISNESKDSFYLENMVFVELRRRRAKVLYWQHDRSGEIDFVAEMENGELQLIQVAWSIDDQKTLEREIKPFADIKAQFPKTPFHKQIIITAEPHNKLNLPPGIDCLSFARWSMSR